MEPQAQISYWASMCCRKHKFNPYKKGNIMPDGRQNNNPQNNMSEEEAQRGRSKGGKHSSGSFEKGSERAKEAGRKGGKASH